jgi:hypothetical protein
MAPVARGVPDGDEERNVTAAGFGERLLTPLIPIDGVVGVLQKVGGGGVC